MNYESRRLVDDDEIFVFEENGQRHFLRRGRGWSGRRNIERGSLAGGHTHRRTACHRAFKDDSAIFDELCDETSAMLRQMRCKGSVEPVSLILKHECNVRHGFISC
jgi:hypothetical protein